MCSLELTRTVCLAISVVCINTVFPIILFKMWIAHVKKESFDPFDSAWGASSFIMSCISVFLMIMFFTIPIFCERFASFLMSE